MEKKQRETSVTKREQPGIMTAKDLGIYIHIPFCVRKCDYCDFLSAPETEETKRAYVDALLTEICSYQGRTAGYTVPTIFFGGGTPSCIPEQDIARIMSAIKKTFTLSKEQPEITIEVNPGTVTREKLLCYQQAGINRISFGLQTTDNTELKKLGRIHCFEDFLENYRLARELGFRNINVDLMSALPGQTVASWEKTLCTVADLEPEHISAYSLIIEEGTDFYDRYRTEAPYAKELPDEETDRQIYYRTKQILEHYQYHRYEISNYAREGLECRHNNSYWVGTDYLGFGLGASSLLDGARFSNIHDIKKYINRLSEYQLNSKEHIRIGTMELSEISMGNSLPELRIEYKKLTREEQIEEFMFLGLRRCEGVRKEAFLDRFGESIEVFYGNELTELERKQVIEQVGDWIRLTDYGIDVSNIVLSEFLFN